MSRRAIEPPVIATKRCVLRPYRKGDEAALRRAADDKAIAFNVGTSFPHPYTLRAARMWVNNATQPQKDPAFAHYHWAIECDGVFAGGIGLEVQQGYRAHIGYWLGRDHWGKGLATETTKVVTRFAFAKLKLKRVFTEVIVTNKASAHVLEKAGYRREGIAKNGLKSHGKVVDSFVYAKTQR